MQIPAEYGDLASEKTRARKLAVCDASALPRMGVKGPQAAAWLAKQGVSVPEKIYGHSSLDGGEGLIIRTGTSEFFLEDSFTGTRVARLWESAANQPAVYRFFKQDAGFILSGELAFDVLAQTCSYDFKRPGHEFVYTRVAVVSVAVLRQDQNGVPTLRIWCDPSYGAYLFEQLLEITRDVGGDAVGLACYYDQLAQK
jgi:sarcosine oxidase subunit gamma